LTPLLFLKEVSRADSILASARFMTDDQFIGKAGERNKIVSATACMIKQPMQQLLVTKQPVTFGASPSRADSIRCCQKEVATMQASQFD
jgi:hypothetical protein